MPPADLILTNARVYTFTWGEPGPDGAPATDGPHGPTGWRPDAEAVAVGPERIKGAYAWRTLRRAGVRLTFNSDLPGTDYNIFYGLHSAITRRGKDLKPDGGWYPEQTMTPEEALRRFTTWAAYAALVENESGVLAPERWADITAMKVDPLVLGTGQPAKLLGGEILLTVVAGRVVYQHPG